MRTARAVLLIFLLAPLLPAQTTPRKAIERALPMLQKSAAEFVAQRSCFSCHHNALPILTLRMAQDRGIAIDSSVLATIEEKTFATLRAPDALDQTIQAVTLNDPTPNDSYLLIAAAAAGVERSLTMNVRAQQLLRWQRDGHWVTSDFRPPHSSSLFTSTATAVRAIDFYAPAELRNDKERAFEATRKWLRKTRPLSTEDAAFRLLGLVWAGGSAADIKAAANDLTSMQSPDGGWPQLRNYDSDAYSTGEALFALREARVTVTAEWERGQQFLLSTQAPDGTWQVRTRMISPAEVSPPYFSTGFPYEKDEFLSYAGTSWAVMALLRTLADPQPRELGIPPDPEPWMRTALFGPAKELRKLLDTGLPPNRKTSSDTTLLMMAAPDPEKVRLLLSRGADPKTRAASGHDALTIVSAYPGTAASLRALLEAGSDVEPPPDLRARRSPLVFASMTGDVTNVKLLLDRGANPDALTPIAEAITFGHADVVQVLIRAGAETGLREGSGVNLLHWSAITGRADVIPLLVQSGVPINDTDHAGFTALMYAATIDFGHTATLRALLSAGADPGIRNPDGRNALEQARYLGHEALEAELSRPR